jgi:low affinity Fe/Cu permease
MELSICRMNTAHSKYVQYVILLAVTIYVSYELFIIQNRVAVGSSIYHNQLTDVRATAPSIRTMLATCIIAPSPII